MSYRDLIESRIQEAMAAGHFSNLPGEGRPLKVDDSDELAGDQWLGFKLLRDANMLPAWLMLAREIEDDRSALDRLDKQHENLVESARDHDTWERVYPALRRLRDQYESAARALRRKQDRFNQDAPSIHLERPGIWVEYHLDRIDTRVSSPLPIEEPRA